MPATEQTIKSVKDIDVDQYKYGFETIIPMDKAPKGISPEIVTYISEKKSEPKWMLARRLDAYSKWLNMKEPLWAKLNYKKVSFQDLHYYAAPKNFVAPKSLDEVDEELLKTYEKLGIPLAEQEILAGVKKIGEGSKVAVDAVFDSVSVESDHISPTL